jgi:hypothetical protein
VVSTTSFDHWADQRAGLVQCARVRRGGSLENSDHHLLAVWAAGCAMHALDFFEEARQTTTVRVRPSN